MHNIQAMREAFEARLKSEGLDGGRSVLTDIAWDYCLWGAEWAALASAPVEQPVATAEELRLRIELDGVLENLRRYRERAEELEATQPLQNLSCYLIDHCEGETITEEFLQRAVSDMLKIPTYAQGGVALDAASKDVFQERARQLAGEGWTLEHDDTHYTGDLAVMAACYAMSSTGDVKSLAGAQPVVEGWVVPKGQRRDLVRAGALILAEIERIDRAAIRAAANKDGRGV